MMVEPGMDILLEKVDSKYTLVSVCSKRARKIMEKDMEKDEYRLENPVSLALHELADGKLEWTREEAPSEEADA